MQIRIDQLAAHLSKGLQPLYVIHGDEALLAQEATDRLRETARLQGFTERQVHQVVGAHFDWSSLLGAASAMSLFADRQVIEIRIPSGKPGKEGSEALQRYCEQLNDDTLTIITLPKLDRTQLSSGWFTALDQSGVSIKADPITRHQLPGWIAQRLVAQGQSVEAGSEGERALSYFADRVEGNLLAAHQEIQKLGLLFPNQTLSFSHIERSVLKVARFDVFQLSEAIWSAQPERVLRMLSGLEDEGEAAVLVHWALADDIRSLKRVKEAMARGKPLPLALRENRVWGVKEKLFERVLPQISPAAATHLVEAAQVVDGIIKGLPHPEWPLQPWLALQRLALMMVTLAQGRQRDTSPGAPRLVLKTRTN